MKTAFFRKLRVVVWRVVRNKYLLLLLVSGVFIVFIDEHNLIKRWERARNIRQIKKEIARYKAEIEENKLKLRALHSDDELLEKLAREEYLMKKRGEDVFILDEK